MVVPKELSGADNLEFWGRMAGLSAREARSRAAELLTAFAADHVADVGTDVLCARVSAAFEEYCGGLLDGLKNAVLPVEAAEARWVRDHYVPLMVEFATAAVRGKPYPKTYDLQKEPPGTVVALNKKVLTEDHPELQAEWSEAAPR